MTDEIVKWISAHYPLLFLILCVVVITVIITIRYSNWSHRLKKTEAECEKIEKVLTPQLSSINSSLTTLSGSFNSLIVYLKGRHGEMDTSLFISKSPIQLTELGKRVLEAIGGREFIDNNLSELMNLMDAKGIKTALDSQTYAPVVINQISTQSSFNKIKDYAFKNPYYKEKAPDNSDIDVALDMGTITNIMGIYLRDKYLETHPHLKPEDIPSGK